MVNKANEPVAAGKGWSEVLRIEGEIGGIYQVFGKAVLHDIIDVAADSLIS